MDLTSVKVGGIQYPFDLLQRNRRYPDSSTHPHSCYPTNKQPTPNNRLLPRQRSHPRSSSLRPHIAHWILNYALLHSALIILPKHRLLPESNGLEILSNIHDFWSWFHTFLPFLPTVSNPIKKPSHPLIIGESAGAYLALQSALLQLISTISAIIMQNPMLDLSAPWYTEEYDKNMFSLPTLPRSVLEGHLYTIEAAKASGKFKPVVSAAPRIGMRLCFLSSSKGASQSFWEGRRFCIRWKGFRMGVWMLGTCRRCLCFMLWRIGLCLWRIRGGLEGL